MDEPAEDVLRFVADQIDTVPHLETLLVLWENQPAAFSAEHLAARIFVSEQEAARILNDLRQRNLVTTNASPAQYAYDPDWDQSGELMGRIAVTYRRHLIRVATLIHTKASPAVREFARAFERKREP